MAHIAGFVAGVLVALVLMFFRVVRVHGNLPTVLFGKLAWAIFGKPPRMLTATARTTA